MPIEIYSPESVGFSSSRLARIKDVMQDQVNQGNFAGISTLIARHGKVIHFEQVGLKDKEANQPMQADTLFRFYSMTKPIICTAFMCLYEQGKFDLKDPVAKYIPAFGQLKVLEKDSSGIEKLVNLNQPVTIHHLLTHTSGLVYDFYEDYSVCALYREKQIIANNIDSSLEKFVDKVCQMPLAFQPGSKWYYSVSIDVVARLIEVIAKKPLNEFLRETIFKPLGMVDTDFFVPENKRHRVAAMYGGIDLCAPNVSWTQMLDVWQQGINKRLDVSTTCPITDPNFVRGGSGLVGTAEDYLRFTQMLLNKGQLDGVRILSSKTIELMHMNNVNPALLPIGFADWKLTGYGFGLGSRVLINVAENQLIGSEGEFGWAGAAKTYYWIDPKEDIIGIFLTQYMCNFSMIERVFQTLTYQALVE